MPYAMLGNESGHEGVGWLYLNHSILHHYFG